MLLTHYSKWDDVLLVTLLKDEEPTVLFICLVPAVNDLVTPLLYANTLAVITSELLISTAGYFDGQVVGQTLVTPYHSP